MNIAHRSVSLTSTERAPDNGLFTFAVTSEEPYERWDGIEVLDHNPGSVDLAWAKSGNAPLLDTHDRYSLDNVIGVIADAWLEDGRVYVSVRFGSSSRAQQIKKDVEDGIIRNVSGGYEVLDKSAKDPVTHVYRVTKWCLKEASFVPLPADETVGMGRAANHEGKTMTTLTAPTPPVAAQQTDEQRAAELQTAIQEIGALGAQHNRSDMARAFINGAMSRGDVPNLALFRGAVAAQLPEGQPLDNTDIGLTAQQRQSFSVLRLTQHLDQPENASLREAAAFELEAVSAAGRARNGSMVLPTDVMNSWNTFTIDGVNSRSAMRSAVRAAESVAGNPSVITTALLSDRFIDNLRDTSALGMLGVTTMGGMTSNFELPGGLVNSTAYWVGSEDANVAETNVSFRKVGFSLKTVGAYIDLTRDFIIQATIDSEAYVRRQLLLGVALEASRAGLYGTGLTGIPTGLKNIAGIGSVSFGAGTTAPTRDKIIDMTAAIDATNQSGEPVFVTNTAQRAKMQKEKVDAGSGIFLLNGNTLHTGETLMKSNQIVGSDVFAGVWSDFVWAMFGGLELKRSTEAKLLSGGIRLVAMQSMDFNVTRTGSFVLGANV